MSWVAVDWDGTEYVSDKKPLKLTKGLVPSQYGVFVMLPKGSIKKLIGRDLTWDDEPIELKEE